MPLLIGLHALKQEVIDRMPLRMIGGGWALDGGGNPRGVNAVDLQTSRTNDYNVASGDYSFIGGGIDNMAQGNWSGVVGGQSNRVIGVGAIILSGGGNYISGNYSAILMGVSNNIFAPNSTVMNGSYNQCAAYGSSSFIGAGSNNYIGAEYGSVMAGVGAKTNKRGQTTKSSFMFAAQGDAQGSQLTEGCKTTNNTPEELFLDGDGGSKRITIAADTTWSFRILVVARRTDADNESAAYDFVGCIDNNAGTTALVGSVTKTVVAEDTAAWDCNVTADNTNDALIVTATGENSKTIQWVAFIQLVETTG
jgi:hypothetical protein